MKIISIAVFHIVALTFGNTNVSGAFGLLLSGVVNSDTFFKSVNTYFKRVWAPFVNVG